MKNLGTDDERSSQNKRCPQKTVDDVIIIDLKINNGKLYKRCKEETVSLPMKINKWKLLGHALRLTEDIPARKAIAYYFEIPGSTKIYQGKARTTLALSIREDLGNAVKNVTTIPAKQFTSTDGLTLIRLDFLRVVFLGGGQFDPRSYFKKNLSNINITLYNF